MTDARGVRHRWVWATTVAMLLGTGACGDGGDDPTPSSTTRATTTTEATTTTTAPERPASTTTTAFDPASVEGQVEAAYLKSWDVYAEAVYNLELDEAALAEAHADPYLTTVREELTARIRDGRAALVVVEHDYDVQLQGSDLAYVIDEYVNHQRLIDPETKDFVEADPNEVVVDLVTLRRIDGLWRVAKIEELQ